MYTCGAHARTGVYKKATYLQDVCNLEVGKLQRVQLYAVPSAAAEPPITRMHGLVCCLVRTSLVLLGHSAYLTTRRGEVIIHYLGHAHISTFYVSGACPQLASLVCFILPKYKNIAVFLDTPQNVALTCVAIRDYYYILMFVITEATYSGFNDALMDQGDLFEFF